MMAKTTLRNDPIRFAGFPRNSTRKPAAKPVEDQKNLFTFNVFNGEGAPLVYRSAFEMMVAKGIDIEAEARLKATVYYGNQLTPEQAKTENNGIERGLMTACGCASVELDWVVTDRRSEIILVEVRYVQPEEV